MRVEGRTLGKIDLGREMSHGINRITKCDKHKTEENKLVITERFRKGIP
jgi:hypothetical protein